MTTEEVGAENLRFDLAEDELGEARAGLLHQAAAALDERAGHLGPGEQRASQEGDTALGFGEDRARLALPEVLPLDLEHLQTDAQVLREDVLDRWRFYLLRFPVELWARPGWGFNQLQFHAAFNPDADETARPRVHDALPSQDWATVASANVDVKMGLGGNLKFAAELPPLPLDAAGIPVEVEAAARAIATVDTGFALTPGRYEIRVPRVRRTNTGLDSITWRLEGGRMVDESDPGLRVVLRVPRESGALQVTAMMRARRNWNSFDADLQTVFLSLGERFRTFFTRGAPIGDRRSWDPSAALASPGAAGRP